MLFVIPMNRQSSKGKIETAGDRLRDIVLALPDGALIGSEQELLARLGVSRSTVRQIARLLEREGLLLVRRGSNGGYYGARPSAETIQHIVSTYLEMQRIDARDATTLASALWIEVLRKACDAPAADAVAMAETYLRRVDAVRPDASFATIRALEMESRTAIFEIAKSRYVELLFNINATFASRRFPGWTDIDGSAEHIDFVRFWRNAKIMELTAIREGDGELGAMAARHIRRIWHARVWLPAGIADGDGETTAAGITGAERTARTASPGRMPRRRRAKGG